MFTTHRKHPSKSRLNDSSLILQTTPNQSFAESAIGKRFTRTKNGTDDTSRSRRLSRGSDCIKEEGRRGSNEGERTVQMAKFAYKPEDLFLQISETPWKNAQQRPLPSSDRTTQVSFLPDSHDRQRSFLGLEEGVGRGFLTEFREELDMKNGEVMLLEDEVQRLRKILVSKQDEHQREIQRKDKEIEDEVKGLMNEIKELKASLQEKNNVLKQQKKTETCLLREIKSLKYQKLMLEKQLEEIYKKKLPKELKEIISYREASLITQLQQLKEQIEQSKTQHESLLQQQILRLKQHNTVATASLNTLNAHSHILTRRLSEKQAHIREKTESFGRHYSNLKENHSVLLTKLKEARKENLKLRRQQGFKSEKMRKMAASSSEQSLTFSLNSNN